MCPLVTAPVRGYQDYQRVDNYDTPLIWNVSNVGTTGPPDSGIIDVSRFAYLAGILECLQNNLAFIARWYADAAGTIQIGVRQFFLDQGINGAAQIRIPNLGPFVKLRMLGLGGQVTTSLAQVFASNRAHPLEFIPTSPVLINEQGFPIGASQQIPVYPIDYYAGPVQMGVFGSGIQIQVDFETLDSNGNWGFLDQSPTYPSGTWEQFRTVTPAGAWRCLVISGTPAVGTYYLTVNGPTTGST